jgi:hypothetical protein
MLLTAAQWFFVDLHRSKELIGLTEKAVYGGDDNIKYIRLPFATFRG